MLSEASSVKIRHWIIAGSVPLYIGRTASFGAFRIWPKRHTKTPPETTTAARRAAVGDTGKTQKFTG
jgi:hypothetical protein